MSEDTALSGSGASEAPIPADLRAKVTRAKLVLFWERLWPALGPALGLACAYVIISLFGVWAILPGWAAIGALALFVLLALAALVPIYRLNWPSDVEALRRLESNSGLAHRPATAYIDPLAAGEGSEESRALWAAHKARVAAVIGRLRAGLPRSMFIYRDPFALRAALGLLLIVAIAYAGPHWRERLLTPLGAPGADTAPPVHIDAWIAPPAYTGRPPVYLTGRTPVRADGAARPEQVGVPAGSELVIRAGAGARAAVAVTPDFATRRADGQDSAFKTVEASDGGREFRAVLISDATVSVEAAGKRAVTWQFSVVADTAPRISLKGPPEKTINGALKLKYVVEDDYGVITAEAAIAKPDDEPGADEEPLVAAPNFALVLPQIRPKAAEGETFKDLMAHPWAGSVVKLTLRARDEAGNTGSSEPEVIALPEREFNKPLARAVIEQRRVLALTPSRREQVVTGLDLLTISPKGFIDDTIVYLALRGARARLAHNVSREQMASVVDLLWDVALRIEDGDLSLAERNLRAAQEALQQALAENASDAEIERLIDELRQALNEYMRALAEAAKNMPQISRDMLDSDQIISSQDLQRMLQAIENMAKSGAREQAQQLLSQLRNMLENLRSGRMMGGASPQQRQMSRALQELSDLIGRQQKLMDETHRLNQQGRQGQPGEGEAGKLGEQQQALREALRQLMERLQGMGQQPNQSFGEAGKNMGDASRALGEGETGDALGQQGKALENLRRGAQGLAQQLAQGMGRSGFGPPGNRQIDPLGRPLPEKGPDLGLTVQVPDEIDAQTVRQILEELRRRLGEQHRPRLELDYLERLLRRF